jgi:hypothetical protein
MALSYAQKLTQLSHLREELDNVIELQARAVAAARGTVLDYNPGTRYSRPLKFDEYSLQIMHKDFGNTQYAGVDYPIDYPIGTQLICATFGNWVGDGYGTMYVTFPGAYLDDPSWALKELPYTLAKQAKDEEREQSAATVRRQRLEAELARIQQELCNV